MLLTHLSRLAQMWFGSITQEKKKCSLDFSRAVKLSFSTVFLIRITSPQCALLLECLFWQCSGDAEWLRKQNPLKHYSPNSFLLTTLLVQFLAKWRAVPGDPEIKRKGCFTSGSATEVVTSVIVYGRDGTGTGTEMFWLHNLCATLDSSKKKNKWQRQQHRVRYRGQDQRPHDWQ